MKKIFENAVWWSGVVMAGLVLGLTIQFVKAWTEPTEAPPGGNVGAPINTGIIAQAKQGVLQVLGLTVYNDPAVGGDVTGKVLTAQNANGAVAWAAGSGGISFTYYCNNSGSNVCTNSGGAQGYCPAGFKQIYDLGSWGFCRSGFYSNGHYPDHNGSSTWYFPPGGNCLDQYATGHEAGRAFVCSQ